MPPSVDQTAAAASPRIRILTGDCREIMQAEGPFDTIIADPPYGDTSLAWDHRVRGWAQVARSQIKPTGSMWLFCSVRALMEISPELQETGWKYSQEIIWEKQNGSGLHADRFKRVHELVVHFYPADSAWSDIYNQVQVTRDATARTVRRKTTPVHHQGRRAKSSYESQDGGPRIMRSVIGIPNCHGHAIHPTEKPVDLLQILIRTSCPPGGLVGDFFAGSGAAAEACAVLRRDYIGCEIDAEMAVQAAGRSLFVAASAERA